MIPRWLLALVVLGAAACHQDTQPAPEPVPVACDADALAPTVVWKRTEVLLADLAGALELPREAVCRELGAVDCGEAHRVALGEADPFGKALYRPLSQPIGTTPVALERVTLSACLRRRELDLAAGADATVFRHFDLAADSVTREQLAQQTTELYRRLMARDPSQAELNAIDLVRTDADGNDASASEVAVLACLAIGSSRESLFL